MADESKGKDKKLKAERDELDSSGTMASDGDGMDAQGTMLGGTDGASVLSAGSIFANRYKIITEGKAGGMGVVYRCMDMTLDQETALKVIHPRLLRSEDALQRFRQEVSISRKLTHDGIVRVHDIGSHSGMEYFTMEWVAGVSLRDMINERKKKGQPFSLEESYQIIHPLAEALQHAHRYTIHRDIKPENIMISEDGKSNLKLMDFGIAKMLTVSQFTTTSIQMGTPYYMAPEQKADTGHVDKRADIYSVGVVLFELLTLENTVGPELPSDLNPKLPKEVDDVFRKAVALKPERRYQEIGEMAAALKAAAEIERRRQEEATKKASQELPTLQEERKKAAEKARQKEEQTKQDEARKRQAAEDKAKREAEAKAIQETKAAAQAKAEERQRREEDEARQRRADQDQAARRREEEEKNRRQKQGKTRRMWLVVGVILVAAVIGFVIYSNPTSVQRSEAPKTFTSSTTGAKFVLIPSRLFYMQTTEVTQGQWKKVMGNNPSYFNSCGDDCPVENISWNDVQDFIRKLNQQEGTDKYRLPTDEEWEYAARAGTTTTFSFGDSEADFKDYGWYFPNSGSRTHSAGQKRPNAWGLYDVHGNVWEWVQDQIGSSRVIRGGSWSDDEGRCRSANRFGYDPGVRDDGLGFRLARTK